MVELKKVVPLAVLLGGAATVAGIALARRPPPPGAPTGELQLKLELVKSPSSPALVKATISVRATAGTTPILFVGVVTTTYLGTVDISVELTELGVWVSIERSWDVPAGETETVSVSGELSNPWGKYPLAPVSRSIEVPPPPGEPPVGELALAVELV